MYYLGVDTGGTFTDFVLFDSSGGTLSSFKVRSDPANPGNPVKIGLERLRQEFGVPGDQLARFVYGTTVATNAVLELAGAKVALFTTRGVRDVLEIQRQWRQRLFDLYLRKPAPLVPRRWRLEVSERVDAHGTVLKPLSDEEISRCLDELEPLQVEAVAIVFLFSFLRPEHERRLAAALRRRFPKLHVTLSSDVSPEFREYERTATTVMNAYTMPKIQDLAQRLEEVLVDAGFGAAVGVIQSNGGVMSLEKARSHPVNTLLSGPAGGVVGAVSLGSKAGFTDLMTMDIGGTSTDIALIDGAEIRLSPQGGIAGYPVRVPQISVHTIGSGGGSIAYPELGLLKVGPRSAGSVPGPACYAQGGAEPTSTDACLCLGYIDPDYFLGGEMPLDRTAAERAIERCVGAPLSMNLQQAALAIVRVQVSNIVAGIRKVSVEAGHDPRDFALMPFGGAGGLYAGLIAEDMGLRRIVIASFPSVLSALGILMTDVKHTRSVTCVVELHKVEVADVQTRYGQMASDLNDDFAPDGIADADIRLEFSADLRYVGQAYEINVRVPGDRGCIAFDGERLTRTFHHEHRRLYGHSAEMEAVELVNLRVEGVGRVPHATLPSLASDDGRTSAPKGERQVLFREADGWVKCPVYDRPLLARGRELEGPALIEDNCASITLLPGHSMVVDDFGNLVIRVPG